MACWSERYRTCWSARYRIRNRDENEAWHLRFGSRYRLVDVFYWQHGPEVLSLAIHGAGNDAREGVAELGILRDQSFDERGVGLKSLGRVRGVRYLVTYNQIQIGAHALGEHRNQFVRGAAGG